MPGPGSECAGLSALTSCIAVCAPWAERPRYGCSYGAAGRNDAGADLLSREISGLKKDGSAAQTRVTAASARCSKHASRAGVHAKEHTSRARLLFGKKRSEFAAI